MDPPTALVGKSLRPATNPGRPPRFSTQVLAGCWEVGSKERRRSARTRGAPLPSPPGASAAPDAVFLVKRAAAGSPGRSTGAPSSPRHAGNRAPRTGQQRRTGILTCLPGRPTRKEWESAANPTHPLLAVAPKRQSPSFGVGFSWGKAPRPLHKPSRGTLLDA